MVFPAREQAALVPVDADVRPLAAEEVRGRTLVSLISTGSEGAGYRGLYGATSFPVRPGYAAVFVVEETGAAVTQVKPGDVAFCMGPHRSCQRAGASDVLKVPDGLAPERATFARLVGVSMSTLTTTAARPPERVVVAGLGLVGHLAAQTFAACGYDVIACDPSDQRRNAAVDMGIADVRPRVPVDDPAVAGQVALVVECSGHEQAVLDGCRVVRKGGEVVLIGAPWERRTDIPAFDVLHAVFHRYVVLRSGWEWEVPLRPTDFRRNSIFGNIAAAMRWIADGRIRVDGLVTSLPPDRAQEAYQALMTGCADRLGIVFDWSDAAG